MATHAHKTSLFFLSGLIYDKNKEDHGLEIKFIRDDDLGIKDSWCIKRGIVFETKVTQKNTQETEWDPDFCYLLVLQN